MDQRRMPRNRAMKAAGAFFQPVARRVAGKERGCTSERAILAQG
jgi:hypothetical protein